MLNEDNTVNMKSRSYHHGDLREALVREGLRLLSVRDADALSLREVARGVGVSATSVYRHFQDKDALLTALASEGLAQLGASQGAAFQDAGGGEKGFAATGRAYVRFALDNPALFRLIFASPALSAVAHASEIESEAATLLQVNAARMAAREGGETSLKAVRAWALVHGLAMLMLDEQLPPDVDLVDRVIT